MSFNSRLPSASHSKLAQAGFTLIELMITVAVVAILARIALPSYQQYVLRGRVSTVMGQMAGFGASMQQYYQDNRTYATSTGVAVNGSICGNGGMPSSGSPSGIAIVPAATTDFSFSCTASTSGAPTFTLTATGLSTSLANGLTYTLDQTGARATTATGSTGWPTNTSCWVRNKTGDCS